MPIYTGSGDPKSEDFFMEEFMGFFINPYNEDEWSNEPYPEQKKEIAKMQQIKKYCDGKYSLDMVYDQIQNKTCSLPRSLRDYVINIIENEES